MTGYNHTHIMNGIGGLSDDIDSTSLGKEFSALQKRTKAYLEYVQEPIIVAYLLDSEVADPTFPDKKMLTPRAIIYHN